MRGAFTERKADEVKMRGRKLPPSEKRVKTRENKEKLIGRKRKKAVFRTKRKKLSLFSSLASFPLDLQSLASVLYFLFLLVRELSLAAPS